MSIEIKKPSKEELINEYYQYGNTISYLARKYKTSNPTIRKWLISYNIERKSQKVASTESNNKHKKSIIPSKEILEELYNNNSIDDLELKFSVGQQTIYEWLNLYSIPLHGISEACKKGKERHWNKIIPNKEEFISAYSEIKNFKCLADKFNLSYSSIRKLMKQYDVKTIIPWRSEKEIKLFEYISSLETSYDWRYSDKSLINPYEIDIISDSVKLGIEYCGLYWHSENGGNKDKFYHLNKLEKCNKKGYELITIFESDDMDFIKSILNIKLGLGNRIYARKCNVKQISTQEAKTFNIINHLHSHHNGSVNLGLYYDDKLVMVLVMGKSRFNKQYEWECIRMTTLKNHIVIGGASKLFNFFEKLVNPKSIITFADKRFGNGNVYEKCGFIKIDNTPPSYWYFKKNTFKLYSRVVFQKHKLIEMENYSKDLTEWEIMKLNNYDRIWDCGHVKYVKKYS